MYFTKLKPSAVDEMDVRILIALLPVVFMVHDFEEIIFLQIWLKKNREELRLRFPLFAKRIYPIHDGLSTPSFALATLHLFVAISLCTFFSLYFNSYGLWFGAFIIFFLHILIHIVQWLMWRRYVPMIFTSIAALPYCIYTLLSFLEVTHMHYTEMILWTITVGLALLPLFFIAFYNARKFEAWKRKTFG